MFANSDITTSFSIYTSHPRQLVVESGPELGQQDSQGVLVVEEDDTRPDLLLFFHQQTAEVVNLYHNVIVFATSEITHAVYTTGMSVTLGIAIILYV